MTLPVLNNPVARRLFLARHGLCGPVPDDLGGLIGALGFVQVDSVNTVARAHDMILWSRRPGYRPQALDTLLARDRAVFEHWTHDASVIPVASFPHWRLRFERDAARLAPRWQQWHGDFAHRFDAVLKRIADHGACGSGDLAEGEPRGPSGWWDWHPSRTALEYLWRTGAVSVVRREGFRKIYDLTERVIPATLLQPRFDVEETLDWACNGALDRLGFATSGEIAAFWALATPQEAKAWCARALSEGRVIEVAVQGADGSLRRAYARPGLLDEPVPEPGAGVRILSPFDPALRDRKRAGRLFGFHYRIEIYVPEPQRRYGYYVFPVLEGARLIGRVDVRAEGRSKVGFNPPSGALALRAFWPEPGVSMGKGRLARLEAELGRVALFAGCDRITRAPDWLCTALPGTPIKVGIPAPEQTSRPCASVMPVPTSSTS